MAIRNLKNCTLRKIKGQQTPEATGSNSTAPGRIGRTESSATNPHDAHQGFLDVDELALALMLFLGAVGEGFFQ